MFSNSEWALSVLSTAVVLAVNACVPPPGEEAGDTTAAADTCTAPDVLSGPCESCTTDCDCEPGLTCDNGVCAPTIRSGENESCHCSADCDAGLSCLAKTCRNPDTFAHCNYSSMSQVLSCGGGIQIYDVETETCLSEGQYPPYKLVPLTYDCTASPDGFEFHFLDGQGLSPAGGDYSDDALRRALIHVVRYGANPTSQVSLPLPEGSSVEQTMLGVKITQKMDNDALTYGFVNPTMRYYMARFLGNEFEGGTQRELVGPASGLLDFSVAEAVLNLDPSLIGWPRSPGTGEFSFGVDEGLYGLQMVGSTIRCPATLAPLAFVLSPGAWDIMNDQSLLVDFVAVTVLDHVAFIFDVISLVPGSDVVSPKCLKSVVEKEISCLFGQIATDKISNMDDLLYDTIPYCAEQVLESLANAMIVNCLLKNAAHALIKELLGVGIKQLAAAYDIAKACLDVSTGILDETDLPMECDDEAPSVHDVQTTYLESSKQVVLNFTVEDNSSVSSVHVHAHPAQSSYHCVSSVIDTAVPQDVWCAGAGNAKKCTHSLDWSGVTDPLLIDHLCLRIDATDDCGNLDTIYEDFQIDLACAGTIGDACDDENPCTVNDKCSLTECLPGKEVPCTTPPPDTCSQDGIVVYQPVGVCGEATGLCKYPNAKLKCACIAVGVCLDCPPNPCNDNGLSPGKHCVDGCVYECFTNETSGCGQALSKECCESGSCNAFTNVCCPMDWCTGATQSQKVCIDKKTYAECKVDWLFSCPTQTSVGECELGTICVGNECIPSECPENLCTDYDISTGLGCDGPTTQFDCFLGGNGCVEALVTPCPAGTLCTGGACDPNCQANYCTDSELSPGYHCMNTSTAVECWEDGNGCLQTKTKECSADAPCSGGVCKSGNCPPNWCEDNAKTPGGYCKPGENTVMTCAQKQDTGCAYVLETYKCKAELECKDGDCIDSSDCPPNWCQDNGKAVGKYCKNDFTVVECKPNIIAPGCVIDLVTTECLNGEPCVAGECIEPGSVSVAPGSLDFGAVSMGSTKNLNITITNTTLNSIDVWCEATGSTAFEWSCPGSVSANDAKQVTVTFSPPSANDDTPHNGSLTLHWSMDGMPNDKQKVPLTGLAKTEAVEVKSNPSFLDFGQVIVDDTKEESLLLYQDGDGTVKIEGVYLLSTAAFDIEYDGCTNKMLYQQCEVKVSFTPPAAEFYNTELKIDTTKGDFYVGVQGEGGDSGCSDDCVSGQVECETNTKEKVCKKQGECYAWVTQQCGAQEKCSAGGCVPCGDLNEACCDGDVCNGALWCDKTIHKCKSGPACTNVNWNGGLDAVSNNPGQVALSWNAAPPDLTECVEKYAVLRMVGGPPPDGGYSTECTPNTFTSCRACLTQGGPQGATSCTDTNAKSGQQYVYCLYAVKDGKIKGGCQGSIASVITK